MKAMSVALHMKTPDEKKRRDITAFHTANCAKRITEYLPYRTHGSVVDAVRQGTDLQAGRITLTGDHHLYLYHGKAMEGNPRRATDRPLRYTTTPHAKAGPHYDQRLMEDMGDIIRQEAQDNANK